MGLFDAFKKKTEDAGWMVFVTKINGKRYRIVAPNKDVAQQMLVERFGSKGEAASLSDEPDQEYQKFYSHYTPGVYESS